MLGERVIAMEAIDRPANVFRGWRCAIDTDLLGDVVLSVTFGRTGTTGRTMLRSVADQDAAERLVRRLVARRAGAERRIGVRYRVTECHGFEPLVASVRGITRSRWEPAA